MTRADDHSALASTHAAEFCRSPRTHRPTALDEDAAAEDDPGLRRQMDGDVDSALATPSGR